MLLSLKEIRARSVREAALRADLKARVGHIFALGPNDTASVNEIACPDPGCADRETVILLMRTGERTRALKVPKRMVDITDVDLQSLALPIDIQSRTDRESVLRE